MSTTKETPGNLFNREVALWVGALEAVLVLAIAFGLAVSPEQLAYIMAAAVALLSLVTRQSVTPNPSVVERLDHGTKTVEAGPANEQVKKGVTVRAWG